MESKPAATTGEIQIQVVGMQGRLDASQAPELDEALTRAEALDRRVILNCSQVSYVGSTCLRVILIHARGLRRRGGDLKLCSLGPKVERVLQISGLDRVLEAFPSQKEAETAFQLNVQAPMKETPPHCPSS